MHIRLCETRLNNENTLKEYIFIIALFYCFLLWIACMRTPALEESSVFDELPTAETIRTI